MKTICTSLSFSIALACVSMGEEAGTKAKEMTPEMEAIAKDNRAYEAAFAKADVKALADFYTDDVVYTADDGTVYAGREAIVNCLTAAFAANKGARLTITMDSVRPLTPDVLAENGSTTVVSKDGGVSSAKFTAIHLKKDGKWKISQLVETPAPAASAGENLSELAWLVGEWKEEDKDAGVTIQSRYQWANGGNFITRNVTVSRRDQPVIEGWQIIGWDPVDEEIRSWTFDDAGGYSEGTWTRDGNRWLARESGYAQDGSRTTADHTITRAGDDILRWESTNRTLDGDPLPGIGPIEIHRTKGK